MAAMAQLLEKRKTTISDAEKDRRRAAAERADSSLRLEGLAMSPAAKKISAAWERGEITGAEMMAQIKALHTKRG